MTKKYSLAFAALICGATFAADTLARDYILRGGASVGLETYDRQYEDPGDDDTGAIVTTTEDISSRDDDYYRLRLSPLIDIKSLTARDELHLRYTPGLRYDLDSYDKDIDHTLIAGYSRYLTQRWQLDIADNYRYTDNVDVFSESEQENVELRDREGRRTYWLNQFSARSEYTYLEDSSFTLGYGFDRLDNEEMDADSDYVDYSRFNYFFTVGHRLNSFWKFIVNSSYTRGLYDNEDVVVDGEEVVLDRDLREYRASAKVVSNILERNPLDLVYSFFVVDYDEEAQESTYLHDLTFGGTWNIASNFSVNGGAGPSYSEPEGQDGEWGYNATAGVHYEFEHGAVNILADHGYDQENFDGTGERGLKEFWQVRGEARYQLLQPLALQFHLRYRDEEEDELTVSGTDGGTGDVAFITETVQREIYAAGCGLRYSLGQWYALSLRYDFVRQDSSVYADDYDEHRVALLLSYEKDLYSFR